MEAETAVLGAVLLSEDALAQIEHWIGPGDFYTGQHRAIFKAMIAVRDSGAAIDVVTVGNRLQSDGQLEKIGGAIALSKLLDSVATIANAEHYAKIVAELSATRRVIYAAMEIAAQGFAQTWDAEDFVIEAQNQIVSAASAFEQRGDGVQMIGDNIDRTVEIAVNGKEPRGVVRSHIAAIDRQFGGLYPGELTVLGARPSVGKSCLALNISLNAARNGKRVLYFTLEDGTENFRQRALAAYSQISFSRIRHNAVGQADRLKRAADSLRNLPFGIVETAGLSSSQIHAKAVAHRAKMGGLDLVVIDHLRRVKDKGRDRYDKTSNAVERFADMAKDMWIPVLLLAQLNRGVENRDDKRPRMSDFRESGTIEEDARAVWFLYREHFYDKGANKNEAELIASKVSQGAPGVVRIWCELETMRFADWGGDGQADPYHGETRELFENEQGDGKGEVY